MAPAMVHLVSLDPEVPVLKVPVPVMVDLVSEVTVLNPAAMVLLVPEVPAMVRLVLEVRVLEGEVPVWVEVTLVDPLQDLVRVKEGEVPIRVKVALVGPLQDVVYPKTMVV